jgi:hypothetical protein
MATIIPSLSTAQIAALPCISATRRRQGMAAAGTAQAAAG